MAGTTKEGKDFAPKILAFSTNNISDPGIDLAGSSHMHYPPSVMVISMPCTSGIKPKWILHAVKNGFDGVFIAADGEECAYLPDCSERASKIVKDAQELLKQNGYEAERLKMSAICSVCAGPFTGQIKEYYETLKKLGPARKG